MNKNNNIHTISQDILINYFSIFNNNEIFYFKESKLVNEYYVVKRLIKILKK